LWNTSLGPVRDGLVLPVFSREVSAIVLSVQKFRGKAIVKGKFYLAWSGVQESLTMNLHDMIIELLKIQSKQDTLHPKEMLQAIADSMGDTTQTEAVTATASAFCLN